jgi:O-acetyl-ADP-ribose deacetylase (regulator of RNase III)
MIMIKRSNLLWHTEHIIAHQVNCMGVMGSGVAKQIKDKWPKAFEAYRDLCNEKQSSKELLGTCQIVDCGDAVIANLFNQYNYGRDKIQTDYEALQKTLGILYNESQDRETAVAMPYRIGCDRGGGSWGKVLDLIEDVFQDEEVFLYKYAERK